MSDKNKGAAVPPYRGLRGELLRDVPTIHLAHVDAYDFYGDEGGNVWCVGDGRNEDAQGIHLTFSHTLKIMHTPENDWTWYLPTQHGPVGVDLRVWAAQNTPRPVWLRVGFCNELATWVVADGATRKPHSHYLPPCNEDLEQ